jgi:THAP domain
MVFCFVDGCSTDSENKKGKHHFFRPPKKSLVLWRKTILKKGKVLQLTHRICEKHFEEHDIIKKREYKRKDGPIIVPLERWHLADGAVPKLHLGKHFVDIFLMLC